MADRPISDEAPGDDLAGDVDARRRFMDEYAVELRKRARRGENDKGRLLQTPHDAALELIAIAEEALSSPEGRLPEAVRIFLHESLQAVMDGKDANVALGIRATKGRRPLDDLTVNTILAHVGLGLRHGLGLADAKAATLHEVETLWDGGRTVDWLEDLLGKHQETMQAMETLSDVELAGVADFECLKTESRIK